MGIGERGSFFLVALLLVVIAAVAAGGPESPPNPRDAEASPDPYRRAEALITQEDYEGTLRALAEALAAGPERSRVLEIHKKRGQALQFLMGADQPEAGRAAAEAAIEAGARDPDREIRRAYLEVLLQVYRLRRDRAGVERVRLAMWQDPGEAAVRVSSQFALIEHWRDWEILDEKVAWLEGRLQEDPHDLLALSFLGEIYEKGDPERARGYLQKGAEAHPGEPIVTDLYYRFLQTEGDHAGIADLYLRVIETLPVAESRSTAALRVHGAWKALGTLDEGLARQRARVEKAPGDLAAWSVLYEAARAVEDLGGAADAALAIYRIRPGERGAALRVADCCRKAGREAEAVEVFRPLVGGDAAALEKDTRSIFFQLVEEAGLLDAEIERLRARVAAHPEEEVGLDLLFDAYRQAKDETGMAEVEARLLVLHPDDVEVWTQLAGRLDRLGRKAEALDRYLAQADRFPAQRVNALIAAARIATELGDQASAVAAAEGVIEATRPVDMVNRIEVARYLAASGRPGRALDVASDCVRFELPVDVLEQVRLAMVGYLVSLRRLEEAREILDYVDAFTIRPLVHARARQGMATLDEIVAGLRGLEEAFPPLPPPDEPEERASGTGEE